MCLCAGNDLEMSAFSSTETTIRNKEQGSYFMTMGIKAQTNSCLAIHSDSRLIWGDSQPLLHDSVCCYVGTLAGTYRHVKGDTTNCVIHTSPPSLLSNLEPLTSSVRWAMQFTLGKYTMRCNYTGHWRLWTLHAARSRNNCKFPDHSALVYDTSSRS